MPTKRPRQPSAPFRRVVKPVRTVVEHGRPLSRSMLWEWQREFFAERGIGAWSRDEVPHFVTNNVALGHAYADVLFAAWRDCHSFRVDRQPLTIVELGAGTGRLAYHVLCELRRLCELHGVPFTSFRYVLTDQTAASPAYWRQHSHFAEFFAAGVLDLAVFDLAAPGPLHLEVSGAILSAGDLNQPLVVIANYVFDSVPADVFYVHDGVCRESRVTLSFAGSPPASSAGRLSQVEVAFSPPVDGAPVELEPWLQPLLDGYARSLQNTYLVFPTTALRCLEQLSAFSAHGLVLLSADKGGHELEDLAHRPPPTFSRHGSVSLDVNYHAIRALCELCDGIALFPPHRARALDVTCCLIVEHAAHFVETRAAFHRRAADFAPDDYYILAIQAARRSEKLGLFEVLAQLRLSRYDANTFLCFAGRLRQLAADLSPPECDEVRAALARVWERYFPIGEPVCPANEIAIILCTLGAWEEGLRYFDLSLRSHGPSPKIERNRQMCLGWLRRSAPNPRRRKTPGTPRAAAAG